jgi:hypothetical protein
MSEVLEKTDLEILEKNFEAAKNEIRELDLSALQAMKSLDNKDAKPDDSFDTERYRDLKRKLQDRLPGLEQKLLRARIPHVQAEREELQRQAESIMPKKLKTKAEVVEAEKLLRRKLEAHYRLDLELASIDNRLAISFEELRSDQRRLQELIRNLTCLSDGATE